MNGSQVRNALAFLLTLVLAVGCSSSSPKAGKRPANIPQPDINLSLAHDLFFGSGNTAPAVVDVEITNRAAQPIVVRRIEVDSPGMTQYGLYRAVRDFKEVVGPGETKSVAVFTTAQTTVRRPSEPLTLRALVEFETGDIRWREMVTVLGNRAPY